MIDSRRYGAVAFCCVQVAFAILNASLSGVAAFSPKHSHSLVNRCLGSTPMPLSRGPGYCALDARRSSPSYSDEDVGESSALNGAKGLLATVVIGSMLTFSPMTTRAYDSSDYASETVTTAVQSLKTSSGDVDKSFSVFEDIAAIITEGKGVGGSLSYTGVKLERGYVSDEDTTIYNPGLSLLTESEKERLVDALVSNRKIGLQKNAWSENNQFAFDFLKQKLDPLHMYELKGYLGILPFYGAAIYLATFFVQQNFRNLFPAAYIIGAVAVFGPIFALVAFGS